VTNRQSQAGPKAETRQQDPRYWLEETNYVVEGGKSLILINGATAAGILTFIGSNPPTNKMIFYALYAFAGGVLFGAILFLFAYLAQVFYPKGKEEAPPWAKFFFMCGILCASASIGFFVFGIYAAGQSLSQQLLERRPVEGL
jgi:hypothetical protein